MCWPAAALCATPLLDTPFPAAQSHLRHSTRRRLSSSPSALLGCRLFFSFLSAPLWTSVSRATHRGNRYLPTAKNSTQKKNTAGQLSNALPCLVASLSNALTPSRLPCCCETRPAGSPTFVFYRPHAKWACLSATPLLDTPFPAAQSPLRHPTLRRLSSSPSALLGCRLFFSFLPTPL